MKKFILSLFAITMCFGLLSVQADAAAKSTVAKKSAEVQEKATTDKKSAEATVVDKEVEAKKKAAAEKKAENASALQVAIKKYKDKNYVGCIQDMQDLVKKDPANAVAYYYMAISYATIGKSDAAIDAYRKVSDLSSDAGLTEYAQKGEKCLVNPESCDDTASTVEVIEDEFTKFLKYGDAFSEDVNNTLKDIRLKQLKDSINKDASQKDVMQKSEMPTNDEIAEAVKTLAKIGVNPLQMGGYQTQYMTNQAMYQNPEYMQLQMLLGNNNRQNGNDFMSMLPYFMSQGNNGTNPNISADLIKNMMTSSMIGDLSTTFNMDNNR